MDIVSGIETSTIILVVTIGLLIVGLGVGAVVAAKLSRNPPTHDRYG